MNDTFSFHAPADVFRRRVDPRWIRLGAVTLLVVVAVASFARWVVASENAADRRRAVALGAPQLGGPQGPPVETGPPVSVVPAEEAAAAAADTAVSIARDVHARTGSFEGASTALLAQEAPDLIFVDGPSVAPSIVSVLATTRRWAAAVMAEPGRCLWIATNADGLVRYGEGSGCTGDAATDADLPAR